MGNTDSAQQLGERVIAARRKLEQDRKIQQDRVTFFKSKSPKTISVMIESIEKAFKTCSPFLESVLLVVWECDSARCKNIILKACTKVLNAPIIKSEYQWFQKYIFPSSIWMNEVSPNHYMYEELLDIANNMSSDIVNSMDNIYEHLKLHWKFNELTNIKNQTYVSRQDDKSVGLLQENFGQDAKDDNIDEIKTFIDSNVAINILTTTAKTINDEFQNHVKTSMSHYGMVADGPIKNVERCQSKLENDYQNAQFPKAAKLLDLVRCSITFNTLQQLVDGYHGLISHINKNKSIIELSRVKNGFLDAKDGGYRDIKLNVIYHSQINIGVSMICEIQLLFGQYLHEKKRIHKLYNVLRQQKYFKMVVTNINEEEQKSELTDIKDLKLKPVLNMTKEVQMGSKPFSGSNISRCCMDSELKLLAVEGTSWYGCIDMNNKKPIFKEKTNLKNYGRHTSNWIMINNKKYLSIKTAANTIKIFEVKRKNNSYSFQPDKSLCFSVASKDNIFFSEFDRNFENILIVKNGCILEKRSLNNINIVKKSIQLRERVESSYFKQLSLSNDGNFCILAGGLYEKYAYFIDIENDKQIKLKSGKLNTAAYAPCFINGEPNFIAVGDYIGNIEIWDVFKQKVVKNMKVDQQIQCTTSTNNILAVASMDKMLRLYDVRNWEILYSQKYDLDPISIHLTADSRYLTIGGWGGEKCVVLQIQ